jgi:hypothetical protein
MKHVLFFFAILMLAVSCRHTSTPKAVTLSGNPLFEGWYADPEAIIYDGQYWIFPTFSAEYEKQVHFDCFSSPDLINWPKPRISTSWPEPASFSDRPMPVRPSVPRQGRASSQAFTPPHWEHRICARNRPYRNG